jgi:two-component system OmpR family response regulator
MMAMQSLEIARTSAPAPTVRVAVFDEDSSGREALCRYLEAQGFAAIGVDGLTTLSQTILGEPVNLVVFRAHSQGAQTSVLCRQLSRYGRTPLIVMTPEDDDLDRILCLELGADDVLTQPVNNRELLARMRSVLRRRARVIRPSGAAVFRFAGFRFDPSRRELWAPSGAPILLTATEANLLRILLSQGEDKLSRGELATEARVASREGGRALDLHISRLRRKLEEDGGRGLILTHRNLGYQIASPVAFG